MSGIGNPGKHTEFPASRFLYGGGFLASPKPRSEEFGKIENDESENVRLCALFDQAQEFAEPSLAGFYVIQSKRVSQDALESIDVTDGVAAVFQ
jgi:hypothetical protein